MYPSFQVKQSVLPYLCSKAQAATGGFFVRRAYFVGQNYAAHAREMGAVPRDKSAAAPSEPFFFGKPADCVFFPADGSVKFPSKTNNYQYEGELVVAIGQGGSSIPADQAYKHVCGYAVGLDMTRRDIQLAAKAAGRPWDMGKAFDYSAPCSPILLASPTSTSELLSNARIYLKVNGSIRQDSNLSDMITDIPNLIAFLSDQVELKPGDLIFTGTPEGVGKVDPGDEIEVGVEGVTTLTVKIVQ